MVLVCGGVVWRVLCAVNVAGCCWLVFVGVCVVVCCCGVSGRVCVLLLMLVCGVRVLLCVGC